MRFEQFKKHIEDIQRLSIFQDNVYSLICKYNKESYDEVEITLPTLEANVLSLLKMIMNDKYDWIDYWMYELDFGRKYHDGCVTDNQGNSIKLATIEDLWNLITEDNSNN